MSDVGETATHYNTLGVPAAGSAAQIKSAFRRLVRTHHPDAGGSVEAMAALNDAMAVLGDPERRSAYDLLVAVADQVVIEPEAWGSTDEHWLDAEVADDSEASSSPTEPLAARRLKLRLTLFGWLLVLLGGAAASTLWTWSNGATPPPASGAVPLVIGLAVISASRLRGRGLASALWRAVTVRREVRDGGSGWLGELALRLVGLVAGLVGWVLLSSLGMLATAVVVALAASGGLVSLGVLPSAGLLAACCGGLVARNPGAWAGWFTRFRR